MGKSRNTILSTYAIRSAGLLLAGYVLAILLPIDPDAERPGTRLSGDVVEDQTDWSFIDGGKLVTVQTSTWYLIPHSVTVTSWVAGANFYLGCGRCGTKIWPTHIARNPDVVVKIDGKLYKGRAFLATGAERRAALSVPLGDDIADGDQAYRIDLR